MKIKVNIKEKSMAIICLLALMAGPASQSVFADSQFSVSPMTQKIVLIPGEQYHGSFEVVNPVSNNHTFCYKTNVEPFFADENAEAVFENNGDYNQIVDWLTLEKETGTVEVNDSKPVNFVIDVPENAPAGGQYATIKVTSCEEAKSTTDGVNIQNILSIAHLIFAEVAGETKRIGEIIDADVPSFLLSGNISGSSVVKNTGNVHDTAKYTLQVFPLFSSEEVYTNEENPVEKNIMPERELYNKLEWEETPNIGIFNVIYTVEFQGATTQVSKMVIVCPIWLLFLIIFVIVALIIWIVLKVRNNGKKSRQAESVATE